MVLFQETFQVVIKEIRPSAFQAAISIMINPLSLHYINGEGKLLIIKLFTREAG